MATERRFYSDLAIPPGEYLAEVLAARGMSQSELARRTGRPIQAINEIIKGDKSLTPATALQLEKALGVPAHIWTGLESRYQLIRAREEERRALQGELPYLKRTPYKQLADMGRVARTRDGEHKVRELHRFYGVSSLANLPGTWASAPSFRCGKNWEASSYSLAAWLRCAELQAAGIPVKPFGKPVLKASLRETKGLSMKQPEEFLPILEKRLAACGIVLVLVPHFPRTYIHGAVFWPRAGKAVLALSIRGKWADIFWFSLFHEIGHLMLHKKRTFVDDGEISPGSESLEAEANVFAANALLPAGSYREFVGRMDLSVPAVKDFARVQGIAPGIVVGRLQHEGLIGHDSKLNRLRERYEWRERV